MMREDPSAYDQELEDIIEFLRRGGIGVSLLLNAPCDGGRYTDPEEMAQLLRYLSSFRHLAGVTVSNAYYGWQIKSALPHLKVKASVIAVIDSVRKAQYWETYARTDVITVAGDITKRMPLLKRIRQAVGVKIQMVVNSGCISSCPLLHQHYNYLSHVHDRGKAKEVGSRFSYELACMNFINQEPWSLFTSQYIAPRNLHHYDGIVDEFKLVDRSLPTEKVVDYLDMYIEGRSDWILPQDPLWGFREPEGLFEQISHCDRDCGCCDWCRRTWKEQVEPVKKMNGARSESTSTFAWKTDSKSSSKGKARVS
jgi:collagenase-like PrtC family protease